MGMRYLLIAVMLFSMPVVAEEGSGEGMAMKSFESAQYYFGGEMGKRIEANLENWLLRAPDANPGLLETAKQYTIATVSDGNTISGTLDWTNKPNSHWQVKPSSDGTLKLFYVRGSVLWLR